MRIKLCVLEEYIAVQQWESAFKLASWFPHLVEYEASLLQPGPQLVIVFLLQIGKNLNELKHICIDAILTRYGK